jgi:hypothetical protein
MLNLEGKMTSIYVLGVMTGLLAAILGHLVAFWRLKWKTAAGRRTDWEKLRRPIYAEAFKHVSAIDQGRGDAENFEAEIKKFADWIPANACYLPPKGIELVFGVVNRGTAYSIDIHNRDVDSDTRKWFLDVLQAAKDYFVDIQDIRWLPEDHEQPKKTK